MLYWVDLKSNIPRDAHKQIIGSCSSVILSFPVALLWSFLKFHRRTHCKVHASSWILIVSPVSSKISRCNAFVQECFTLVCICIHIPPRKNIRIWKWSHMMVVWWVNIFPLMDYKWIPFLVVLVMVLSTTGLEIFLST